MYAGTGGVSGVIDRRIAQSQAGALNQRQCSTTLCKQMKSALSRRGESGFVDPQQLAKTYAIAQLRNEK